MIRTMITNGDHSDHGGDDAGNDDDDDDHYNYDYSLCIYYFIIYRTDKIIISRLLGLFVSNTLRKPRYNG